MANMQAGEPIKSPSQGRVSNENDWDEVAKNQSEPWDLDYVRSLILDADEKLHLQEMWRRTGLACLTLGNLTLITLATLATTNALDQLSHYATLIYLLTCIFILASPGLVYWQYKRARATRIRIKKLHIVRRRIQVDNTDNTNQKNALPAQKRYRDDVPDLISKFREDAGRTRRVHNRFQSIIIVGSVATSAIATASVSFVQARWFTVAASAAVGLAAGFTGYFKYHERSFNSQQTADAIEREYEAVELRVGKYATKEESEAYAIFAETVERLRDEQNKRQQQLDQPVEVTRDE